MKKIELKNFEVKSDDLRKILNSYLVASDLHFASVNLIYGFNRESDENMNHSLLELYYFEGFDFEFDGDTEGYIIRSRTYNSEEIYLLNYTRGTLEKIINTKFGCGITTSSLTGNVSDIGLPAKVGLLNDFEEFILEGLDRSSSDVWSIKKLEHIFNMCNFWFNQDTSTLCNTIETITLKKEGISMESKEFGIVQYFEKQNIFIKENYLNSLDPFINNEVNCNKYPIFSSGKIYNFEKFNEHQLVLYTNVETRLLNLLQDYTSQDLESYQRINYFNPDQIIVHIDDNEPGSDFKLLEYSMDIPYALGLDEVVEDILNNSRGMKEEIKNEAINYLESRKAYGAYKAFGYILRINGIDYIFDLPGKNITVGLTNKKAFPEALETVNMKEPDENLSLIPAFLIKEILIYKEAGYQKTKEKIKKLVLNILVYLYGFEYQWEASTNINLKKESLSDPKIISEYLKDIKKNTLIFTMLEKLELVTNTESFGWNASGAFRC